MDAESKLTLDIKYVEEVAPADDANRKLDEIIDSFTEKDEKRINRRIDVRVVLLGGLVFMISTLDRTNIALANISGMNLDLNLSINNRYAVVVSMLFATYIPTQLVVNVLLRKMGPRAFLSLTTLSFGIVTIGAGFVHDWTSMIPIRLLLGIFEAGTFPCVIYLVSCWYPRYSLAKRAAAFYMVGLLSGAFSGILAFAFSKMNGLGVGEDLGQLVVVGGKARRLDGIAGWRWIFIMEGVITILIALLAAIFVVDFPEKSSNIRFAPKFLSERDLSFVVAKISKDRLDVVAEEFTVRHYLSGLLDLRLYGYALIFACGAIGVYGIAYELPVILTVGMGFAVAPAQCLVAPPYIFSALLIIVLSWAADKYHVKGPLIMLCYSLSIIGLPLMGLTDNVGVRYFGVFLATAGVNCANPLIITWQANNIRGQWKRALFASVIVMFGGMGALSAPFAFRTQDAPRYVPGIAMLVTAMAVCLLTTIALEVSYWYSNKQADKGKRIIYGLEGFRYTL